MENEFQNFSHSRLMDSLVLAYFKLLKVIFRGDFDTFYLKS